MRGYCRLICLFILSCCYTVSTKAQNYPIQAGISLSAPYSPEFSTWGVETERISISLLNKDFATPDVDVYLKLLVEGPGITIQTRFNYISPSVISLTAGAPSLISGTDVKDLFDVANLDFYGLDKTTFIRNGQILPEGIWKISVIAFNTSRNLQVSNQASTMVALFKHSPPLLNFPSDQTSVQADLPQFVNFQWTPRHTISAGLQGNVRYRLRMVELNPVTREPNEAFQSTLIPFFETLTDQTFYTYGPEQPPLIPGRAYAWQIQAIDVNGADLFENNGYSQIFSFLYGNECPAPFQWMAKPSEGRSFTASWDTGTDENSYILRYRKLKEADWKTEIVRGNSALVSGLLPSTIYEVQLSRLCASGESKPTTVIQIKTDSLAGAWARLAAAGCGRPAPKFDLTNRNPLPVLQAGDKIDAADFKITVLSAEGLNGVFSGSGTVLLPFTGKVPIPCHWENIVVNQNYRMVSGKISLLSRPLVLSNLTFEKLADRWMDLFGGSWNLAGRHSYSGTVSGVTTTSDGRIKISGDKGDEYLSQKKNTIITDSKGRRWYVSAGGELSGHEEAPEKPVVKDENTGEGMPGEILATGPVMKFSANGSAVNAWDAFDIRQQTAGTVYDQLDAPGGSPYYAAWKMLVCGKTDVVTATVSYGALRIPEDSIRFLRSDGTRVRGNKLNDSTWQLEIRGRMHLWADALWATAVLPGTTTRRILGKLNLISVDEKKIHVRLVPVHGQGGAANVQSFREQINALANPFGVRISVEWLNSYKPDFYDPAKHKLPVKRNVLNAGYGAELQKIINGWSANSSMIPDDTAIIFLAGPATDDTKGYMPLNNRFGFIFCGNSPPAAHTVLHELAHGLFALQHPFGENEANARQTLNLMDYAAPYAFTHWAQWKQIHDKNELNRFLAGLRQKEKDAKFIYLTDEMLRPFLNPDTTFTFINPAGEYIKLPSGANGVLISTFDRLQWETDNTYIPRTLNIPFGALIGFTIGKNTYMLHSNSDGTVLGYKNKEQGYYNHKAFRIDSTKHVDAGIAFFPGSRNGSFVNLGVKVKSALKSATIQNFSGGFLKFLKTPSVIDITDTLDYSLPMADLLKKHSVSGAPVQFDQTLLFSAISGNDKILFDGQELSFEDFLKLTLSETSGLSDFLSVFAYISINRDQLNSLKACVGDLKKYQRELLNQFDRQCRNDEYFNRQKYYIDARDAFSNAARLSTGFLKLQELYTKSAGAEDFARFFASADYAPCVTAGLSANERKYIIRTIIADEDYWWVEYGKYKYHNVILQILETAPPEQYADLYPGFRLNRYSWLREIWGKNEEILEGKNRQAIFFRFLEMFFEIEANEATCITKRRGFYMAESGFQEFEYPAGINEFYLRLDPDRVFSWGNKRYQGYSDGFEGGFAADGKIHLSLSAKFMMPAGSGFSHSNEVLFNDTLFPLEMMNVIPASAELSEFGLSEGNIQNLPAVLVLFIEKMHIKKLADEESAKRMAKVVRYVGAVVFVATAASTGGPAAALGAAFLVLADIKVQQLNDEIQEAWSQYSKEEQHLNREGYRLWNDLKDGFDVAMFAATFGKSGVSSLKSLVGSLRFTQAFSSFVAGSRSFIINLQKRLISAPLKALAAKLGKYVKWGGGAYGKYSTKIDDFVKVIDKESLFQNDALTFLNSEYRTVVSTKSIQLYRTFGGKARVGGTFATTASKVSREELALLDEWNNSMRFEATINIPTGTKMNIGIVGPQKSSDGLQALPGGADQVILPYKWSNSWVVKITDNATGKTYNNLQEFTIDFPDLVN